MSSALAKNTTRLTGKSQRNCDSAILGVLEKLTESENPGFEHTSNHKHCYTEYSTKARPKMRYRNEKIAYMESIVRVEGSVQERQKGCFTFESPNINGIQK
jgi:hypothetical protein